MPKTNGEPSVLAVTDTLRNLITQELPEVWAAQNQKPPKFFQNGIEYLSVSVKVGVVEVSLSVAGPNPHPSALGAVVTGRT
jgi:hypothetical protein